MSAENNIWNEDRRSDRRLKKTVKREKAWLGLLVTC